MDGVPDRLSPVDATFLHLEDAATAMNLGTLLVLEPPAGGLAFEDLRALVEARIAYLPRYRQRLREVPGRLANPVWVDDARFDLDFHVRRAAVPGPGTDEELDALVARIMPRRLDRTRPLWELYLIEGLAGGQVALLTKCHQALVDGVDTVELAQVLLDESPDPAPTPVHAWSPDPAPTPLGLVVEAAGEVLRRPTAVVETLRAEAADLRHNADRFTAALGGLVHAGTPTQRSPLNGPSGQSRRYDRLSTPLDTYSRIRDYYRDGGRLGPTQTWESITVNDVVLAVLAGGLRDWMGTRGRPPGRDAVVRALVPMGVWEGRVRLADPKVAVEAVLVDLPIGEPSPRLRLRRIGYQTRVHRESGRALPARALAEVGGYAPSTIHSLGVRLAGGLSRRVFNLVVTNVPGPQQPVYAAGARVLAGTPVIPLAQGQGLSIGMTSYDGHLGYGFYADRDALPDLAVLVDCVAGALQELADDLPDDPRPPEQAGPGENR